MPELKLLSPAQKKTCHILMTVGAVMLAFGLYMGFVKDGDSVFVFALLGGSVALFVVALSLFLKLHAYRILDPAKVEPKPEAKVEPKPEAKVEPKPEAKFEPKPEAKFEPKPEAKVEPEPEANTDAATLMNTTLGDLVLAAFRKDPEGAGRIFAEAIIQAEAPIAAAKAREAKAERQPEAKAVIRDPTSDLPQVQ